MRVSLFRYRPDRLRRLMTAPVASSTSISTPAPMVAEQIVQTIVPLRSTGEKLVIVSARLPISSSGTTVRTAVMTSWGVMQDAI